MTIANKLRGVLQLQGVSMQELAAALGVTPAALSNKFYRGSFSAADLVKISAALGMELSLSDNAVKVVLDVDDVKEKKKE